MKNDLCTFIFYIKMNMKTITYLLKMDTNTRAMAYLLGMKTPEQALTYAINKNDGEVVKAICQHIQPQDYHINNAIVARNVAILNSLINCGGVLTKELKDLKEHHGL